MYKTLASLFIASSVLYAAEAEPMAAVCDRLVAALEQEAEALESITEAGDISAPLAKVRESLAAQQELFAVDAGLLWQYIDNTEGVKQPIIDVLQRLALQFDRVEKAKFFGSAELRELLGPQVLATPATERANRAKREKLREIDHDE